MVKNLHDFDFSLNDFCSKCDDELAVIAKENKTAAAVLVSRYSKLILVKSEIYAKSNVDRDDLYQEGIVALLNAISSFDNTKGAKFATFAEVCIVNRMKTVLSKNKKLAAGVCKIDELCENTYLSVEETPESIFWDKEFFSELINNIYKMLSPAELRVFNLCMQGHSYKTVAEKLGITEKSVDNAMQRARRKIRACYSSDVL